jgi:hypothetical protein
MKTVNQIRAEQMERSLAFANVISGRLKLDGARKRLAAVEADLAARPRQPTDNRDRIRNHVADLESELAQAETWCREINPDRLIEHDAKIAAAEHAAREAKEAEEAAAEIARLEARAKSEGGCTGHFRGEEAPPS